MLIRDFITCPGGCGADHFCPCYNAGGADRTQMVRRIAAMLQVASTTAWEELADLLLDDRVTVDRFGGDDEEV